MIRVDEIYLRKLENIKKNTGLWLMIAGILVAIFGSIAVLLLTYSPQLWCNRWGGTLYEDNHCYMIDDMQKCLDPNGYIRESSRSITMPGLNLSDLEVSNG